MNALPPSIAPEAAAWMKAQIAMHTARAVAPLRGELDGLDDWANGLFVVLADVLPPLLPGRVSRTVRTRSPETSRTSSWA